MSFLAALVPLLTALLAVYTCHAQKSNYNDVDLADMYPIQVQDVGIDEVPKYATAIHFNIDVVNIGETPYEVTISPQHCCLEIDVNDTDCEVMQLRPSRTLLLGSENTYDNRTGSVSFLFRNLYARFRKGNCSFLFSTVGEKPSEWNCSVSFNTYPDDTETDECPGLDQDPDRSCSPVDCAIKYRGRRNFYRNTTARCEAVMPCHTRGPDGTILAYYDTDFNLCHSLDLNSSENAVYQIETPPDIPADHNMLQLSLTPDNLESADEILMEEDYEAGMLDCNHGVLDGRVCVCDEGWASSGLDSQQQHHWCDVRDSTAVGVNIGPAMLTYKQEVAAVTCLVVLNVVLAVGWGLLVHTIFFVGCRGKCKQAFNKIFIKN